VNEPRWYVEQPEPEAWLTGRLHHEPGGDGPMGRTGARHIVEVAAGERVPLYAPQLDAQLTPRIGREVRLRGKLVDLRGEGLGVELWAVEVADG
jgi:hypothetical protein